MLWRERVLHPCNLDRDSFRVLRLMPQNPSAGMLRWCGTAFPLFEGPTLEELVVLVTQVNRRELEKTMFQQLPDLRVYVTPAATALDALVRIAPCLAPPKLRRTQLGNSVVPTPIERLASHLGLQFPGYPLQRESLKPLPPSSDVPMMSAWTALLSGIRDADSRSAVGRVLGSLHRVTGPRPSDTAFIAHGSRLMLLEPASEPTDISVELGSGALAPSRTVTFDFEQFLVEMAQRNAYDTERQKQSERMEQAKNGALAFAEFLRTHHEVRVENSGITQRSNTEVEIFSWTPQYVLKNAVGELFLFPHAKVGVGLALIDGTPSFSRPYVINAYSHPFLPGHTPRQNICTGTAHPNASLTTVDGGVESLLIGQNILLRGYIVHGRTSRAPYHKLTRENFAHHVISRTDPRLVSGALIVTNE